MIEIRRGESGDLDQVGAIQQASPEAAHWTVADYLGYDFRVAVCGQVVCGFLVARPLGEGEYEILNIAVNPENRRQGVGRALVASLSGGFSKAIFLEVRESNTAARNLYNSMGFKEVNRRRDYYDHPLEAAIVLKFHSC